MYSPPPPKDWPPTFDSYMKIKYFWFVFVFCNIIWTSIPTYFLWNTYRELRRLLHTDKKNA